MLMDTVVSDFVLYLEAERGYSPRTCSAYRSALCLLRDYALMAVAIFSGVRRAELINLQLGDVDLTERALRVNGKGGRWRIVPLAEEARRAVADWLEFRPADCGHDHLFTTTRGNRIHPSGMQRIWRSILRRSSVRREGVSLHTLRHSCATLLLQTRTCDIAQIQRILGHSRLDTTAVYLHIDQDDLRAAMDAHPLLADRLGPAETTNNGEAADSGQAAQGPA